MTTPDVRVTRRDVGQRAGWEIEFFAKLETGGDSQWTETVDETGQG